MQYTKTGLWNFRWWWCAGAYINYIYIKLLLKQTGKEDKISIFGWCNIFFIKYYIYAVWKHCFNCNIKRLMSALKIVKVKVYLHPLYIADCWQSRSFPLICFSPACNASQCTWCKVLPPTLMAITLLCWDSTCSW